MFKPESLISDNLLGTKWLGRVVKNDDPKFSGRIKVRVFGKFDNIDIDDIPWTKQANSLSAGSESGSGAFSVPKLDSIVSVEFENGNLYEPTWKYINHISDELKAEIEDSYENAHSLIYDTVIEGGLKIYFTEERGLILDYAETQINIKPDNSIIVQNPNGDYVELTNDGNCNINIQEKIDINCTNAKIYASKKAWIDSPQIDLGKNATEAVIKGNTFQTLFNSHVHTAAGSVTTPPNIPLTGTELSQISSTQ